MNKIIVNFTIIMLDVILFVNTILAERVYLSYYPQVSWYENSGTQFLIILLISVPFFLILGLIYYFIGRKKSTIKINSKMCFIAIAVFLIPIILDGSLSPILIAIGTILGGITILGMIYIIIKDILGINK